MTMMSNYLARLLCSFSELVFVKEFGCLQGQKIIRKCGRKCASQAVLVVKNPPADSGDAGDTCLIPGSGRSLGVGNRNSLQYSCLENHMDGSPPGSSVHGILQARILEWAAIPFSGGSS